MLFNSNQLRIHQKPETTPNPLINSTKSKNTDNVSSVLIKGVSLNNSPLQCDKNELFCDPLEWTLHSTSDVQGKVCNPVISLLKNMEFCKPLVLTLVCLLFLQSIYTLNHL